MKKSLFILITVFFIFQVSCNKSKETMIIIKDCTGSYLRFNELDYPICNLESVSDLNDGMIVDAKFRIKRFGNCPERNAVHCMMLHGYKIGEYIEILRIK